LVGNAAPAAQAGTVSKSADEPIRLGANENAYGPSSRVREAIRDAMAESNRYPDSARREFVKMVANKHRVSPEQVLTGCGSVEILQLAGYAFTSPQRKLVMASPTFERIGELAKNLSAQVVRVPLTKDFSHDLSGMLAKIGDDTGLVYICNPNNPTASLTPRRELDSFISQLPGHTHVFIDEAYHHFAVGAEGYTSFLDRPVSGDQVIVARTFSKVYGLAGMRLGYGIGSAKTIDVMRRLASPENTNIAGLRGAMVALEDEEALRSSVRRIAADRTEFMKQAKARKLAPIPSHANFAMMDVGRPVQSVIEYFKKQGILVGRPFPPLNTYLRVSFGRPEEMTAFWRAWDQLPAATG
jgi:histidinol-phosphate aminotransferase